MSPRLILRLEAAGT